MAQRPFCVAFDGVAIGPYVWAQLAMAFILPCHFSSMSRLQFACSCSRRGCHWVSRGSAVRGGLDERIDFLQEREPLSRNVANHLSPVGRRTLAPQEARPFELVHEPRDAWRLIHQPVANRERGKPSRACTSQDPQHVVLWLRDAEWRDRAVHCATHQRRGAHHAQRRLFRGRPERFPLEYLFLQCGLPLGHARHFAARGSFSGRSATMNTSTAIAATHRCISIGSSLSMVSASVW